jgi:preprotein translocase subunit SecY
MTIITLTTAASSSCGWAADPERGVGNDVVLIFTGIIVGLPRGIRDLWDKAANMTWGPLTPILMVALIVLMIAVVAFIVYVERSERRIPVQYAKRIVGRKMMGGQTTHLPLKVNAGGVMPVIFASSIVTIPQTVLIGLRDNRYFGPVLDALRWGEPLYTLLYAVGIIFFATYISIVFNPNEVADNMRKYGDLFRASSASVPRTTSRGF